MAGVAADGAVGTVVVGARGLVGRAAGKVAGEPAATAAPVAAERALGGGEGVRGGGVVTRVEVARVGGGPEVEEEWAMVMVAAARAAREVVATVGVAREVARGVGSVVAGMAAELEGVAALAGREAARVETSEAWGARADLVEVGAVEKEEHSAAVLWVTVGLVGWKEGWGSSAEAPLVVADPAAEARAAGARVEARVEAKAAAARAEGKAAAWAPAVKAVVVEATEARVVARAVAAVGRADEADGEVRLAAMVGSAVTVRSAASVGAARAA